MVKKIIIPAVLLVSGGIILFILSHKTDALNPNHQCVSCHVTHEASGPNLNNAASAEDVCLTCHGPAGIATKKASVHTNKSGSIYAPFTMTCRDCHDAHDSMSNYLSGTNMVMVGSDVDGSGFARISTPNSGIREVVFESRGINAGNPSLHSFADNDEDSNSYWDGICETCHTQTYHRNSGVPIPVHHVGETCTTCHPHEDGFLATAGGCSDCHGSPQDNGDGPPTRRTVVSEFTSTSHHVAGGTVTDDDCGVCHYEAVDSSYHMNNQIDLRDPDDGTDSTLISFSQFSRNTNSDVLESWATDVQSYFCLHCHDADGATATNFSGDPLQPFSSPDRDVPDTAAQFSTSNTFHHAVLGAGDNPYCIPSASNGNNITMEPPWNQDATHDLISCFDCHIAGGHGGSNQRMLRFAIDFDTMETVASKTDLPLGMGATVDSFCTLCHKASVYVSATDSEAAGSMYEYHGASQNQHGSAGGNKLSCMGCHAGIVNLGDPVPDNGSARGNIHGRSFTWPTGSFAAGSSTDHFMLGGFIGGWDTGTDKQGNPIGLCSGGDCSHKGSSTKNGQSYSR